MGSSPPQVGSGSAAGGCAAWDGKWDTTYGNLTLQRSVNQVSGQYGNGRTITGTVNGAVLDGEWRYPSGRSGRLRFVVVLDGSFSGWWTEGGGAPRNWSGTCTSPSGTRGSGAVGGPSGGSGAGTCSGWQGVFNTNHGRMTLGRNGNSVTGAYGSGRTISGTVSGSVLTGVWRHPGGRNGPIRFVLAGDGRSFSGTWSEGGGSGRSWTGTCAGSAGGAGGFRPGGCSVAGVTCPGAGGVGHCADPKVLSIMDEWLDRATPPMEPGESLCFDCWGRLLGNTLTGTITLRQNPDTQGKTRCEWLWYLAPGLKSGNGLGTMADHLRSQGVPR